MQKRETAYRQMHYKNQEYFKKYGILFKAREIEYINHMAFGFESLTGLYDFICRTGDEQDMIYAVLSTLSMLKGIETCSEYIDILLIEHRANKRPKISKEFLDKPVTFSKADSKQIVEEFKKLNFKFNQNLLQKIEALTGISNFDQIFVEADKYIKSRYKLKPKNKK